MVELLRSHFFLYQIHHPNFKILTHLLIAGLKNIFRLFPDFEDLKLPSSFPKFSGESKGFYRRKLFLPYCSPLPWPSPEKGEEKRKETKRR